MICHTFQDSDRSLPIKGYIKNVYQEENTNFAGQTS